MILRKVSNLRPDDHIQMWGSVHTIFKVEIIPDSDIRIVTTHNNIKHTLRADDLVEIVIL